MKVLKTITGIVVTCIGISMTTFAWLFYFNEYDEIILLASLYVALFISVIVMALGLTAIPFKKKENNDEIHKN